MRLYSNHDRKAAITEPLLLFSLKPGFPAGLSLFPRPSIAASHFTKTRVEIAVLDNSPCQIAVLYFALAADLIAKAGKYSSKIGILISYVVFANINTGTS